MPIRCGNCRDSHETVNDVRACYGATLKGPKAPPATEKQLTFIATLESERGIKPLKNPKALSKAEASSLIDGLLVIPKLQPDSLNKAEFRPQRAAPLPDVPAGYYATDSLTGAQDTDFWLVQRPNEGRWAGRTFVKRYLGGTGPVDTPRSLARPALEAIVAEGIDKCAHRFAQELGRCYNCGRDLTDELSRRLGIGPVCRNK